MAKQSNVNPFRSQPSRQDALCLALKYAQQFGITYRILERSPYALNKCTLVKIGNGYIIKRNREKFFNTIVLALNDKRLRSHDECTKQCINMALRNLCLEYAGISSEN